MAKRVRLGAVIVDKDKNGNKRTYIGLGQKGKDPQYNITVELIAKDNTGKVIAKQTNGFIELADPRTKPAELLSLGLITEDVAEQMTERASKIPEKIRFELQVKGQ